MRHHRILAAFLAAGAVVSAQAVASNTPLHDITIPSITTERVPNWLRVSGEFQTRVEGRTAFGFQEGNDDAYALVRTRLNISVTPTTWLQFAFQGQDSRAPGLDPGRPRGIFQNPADVRQAYVRIGQGLVKLTAGRQLLNYGAQRLLGPLEWTNTARNWDAVKLEIGTADAKLDLFASSVVALDPNRQIDQRRAGANIHGAYGSLKKLVPGSVFESYLLWKTGGRSIWTSGFRLARPAGPGADYQLELVRQWGTIGTATQSAYAGYGVAGYTFADAPWKLHASGEYSYASGDRNPGDSERRTFDHLLGTNHLFYGLVDIVGWQNMHNVRIGIDAKPAARLQLNADYHWLWLDSPRDALYSVAGTPVVTPKAGNTARSIGTELDFTANWTASPQWKIGGGVGHLFAGDFLKQNSPGSGQTFPYIFVQRLF